MITARRIIFFIFLGLYLIICPLLILYAFGYIFNPGKQEIRQTGLIYLSSAPEGAEVYLGKSRYKYKTPASINELNPGDYKISLKLKGYKPWVQVVSVEPGRAVTFENILLSPKVWQINNLGQDAFVNLIPMRGTGYFLLAKDKSLGSYLVSNWRINKMVPLLSRDSQLLNFPVISIFMKEDSQILVIYGGSLLNRQYLYINLEDSQPEIMDITKFISQKPINIEWDNAAQNILFVVYEDHIDRLDIPSMRIYSGYLEKTKGFGIYNKWIYLLDDNRNVFKYSYDGSEKNLLFDDTYFGTSLFSRPNIYEIKLLQNNIILFIGMDGRLVTNLYPYLLINKGLRGYESYKNKDHFLYWTNHAIGIVEFRPEAKQEAVLNVLYDKGKKITDCFFAYENSHVLFNDNNRIYLLEIEPQGEHHIEFIAEAKSDARIFYSDITGLVYYLDPKNGYLNAVKVIPKEKIAIKPFINKEEGAGSNGI